MKKIEIFEKAMNEGGSLKVKCYTNVVTVVANKI